MPSPAQVRSMTQAEYDAWYPAQVEAFARELADAGMAATAAAEQSEEVHRRALPDGLATPHVHVLHVLGRAGEVVGVLWVGPHPWESGKGYVWNVEIDAPRRGLGLGRDAMLAAEEIARAEGWVTLGLNVFGGNDRARSLYRSLGYTETSVAMDKPVA